MHSGSSYKRLERGRFACLWGLEGATAVELTMSELALFLEGCQLVAQRRLSPGVVQPGSMLRSL